MLSGAGLTQIHRRSSEGFFSPRSVFWRVNREWLVALAGSRALLLELAHPLIAEGVANHSNYRGDPLGRLYRTMRVMNSLVFGSAAQARRAVGHFHHCHHRVHGALAAPVGDRPAGAAYTARDPRLQLWVLATLIDSTLLVYQRFVAPLTADEQEAYYHDALALADMLGLPPAMMPATHAEFKAYVSAMAASDDLAVGEAARAIVAALFNAPVIGPAVRAASFAGLGLLPERFQQAYRIEWGARQEKWLDRIALLSRRIRPRLPDWLCVSPAALLAEWRLRRAG